MLTRLQFRRNQTLVLRRFSNKSSNSDDNEIKQKHEKHDDASEETKKNKLNNKNVDRIQELLKNMMLETKIKEEEYRTKFATAPVVPRKRKQKPDEFEVKTEEIEESITAAAGEVAQALGGDVKKTEAELLSKVLGKINQTSTGLSDLILGMKVDRSKEHDEVQSTSNWSQQVKKLLSKPKSQVDSRSAQRKERAITSKGPKERMSVSEIKAINLFSEQPLNIFTKKDVPNYGTKLDVWEAISKRELELATSQQPANYFQKMILWTEQGKVWKFPINNEQGLEEENDVHFSEHIFLDTLLEDWCPKKGPIRHFMELVCVGLSKNPFYTVQEKRDHIEWYKNYFESKKDLLTEVGGWDVSKTEKKETI